MTLYLSIDDTDDRNSPGTGNLARRIADRIATDYRVLGVTRHQLFNHPDIPMTSHNSCAVIHVENGSPGVIEDIYSRAREMVLENCAPGSNPGIALAAGDRISPEITAFGLSAKVSVLTIAEARGLAGTAGIIAEGLGETGGGLIGSIAGIGLAVLQNDGRFVQKGDLRNIRGRQPVSTLLCAGIDRVVTLDGIPLTQGLVALQKFPRPACINGEAVLFVEQSGEEFIDLKIG
ncbi:MAG: ABC transporter substrate-binding protein [Methanomicrobiaceae archaeon]|nr:ABC transporter substrate-binding protein [Methanomicrobiaceae archaeon]